MKGKILDKLFANKRHKNYENFWRNVAEISVELKKILEFQKHLSKTMR